MVGGQAVAAIKAENSQNLVLQCTAPRGGIVNETGRTQIYRGFTCSIRSLADSDTIDVTTNSNATVTGDGGVQTTCVYSKL